MVRRDHGDEANQRARNLRQKMTSAEQRVWAALRGSRVGFKFRRQHPIAGFVLDFYCDEARVAVELDGSSHLERLERDEVRDRRLRELGILTIRIRNCDPENPLAGELGRVLDACRARTKRDP